MSKKTLETSITALAAALVLLFSSMAVQPAMAASTLKLGYAANGTTIATAKGRSVVVSLDTTKWVLTRKSGLSSFKATQIPSSTTDACSMPGAGCGTSRFSFKLNKAGKAYLMAERTSAGEAIRCVTECTFKVTFKVR
jgi:hypothetical protein